MPHAIQETYLFFNAFLLYKLVQSRYHALKMLNVQNIVQYADQFFLVKHYFLHLFLMQFSVILSFVKSTILHINNKTLFGEGLFQLYDNLKASFVFVKTSFDIISVMSGTYRQHRCSIFCYTFRYTSRSNFFVEYQQCRKKHGTVYIVLNAKV